MKCLVSIIFFFFHNIHIINADLCKILHQLKLNFYSYIATQVKMNLAALAQVNDPKRGALLSMPVKAKLS